MNLRKYTKFHLLCVAIVALLGTGYAAAFNTSMYATESRLATGKWVKIHITENGIYEITYEDLLRMGFSNPEKVHVYGRGGNRINEVMNSLATDDLKAVPILRSNDKICFYGNGPVSFSISDYSLTPRFTRVQNAYSMEGCYFLSENDEADLQPTKKQEVELATYVDTSQSLGFFYHENELVSMAGSGKEMLGEEFSRSKVLINYNLPGLSDSTVVVQTAAAANTQGVGYVAAVLHGESQDSTNYSTSSSRIYSITGPALALVFYNSASPYGQVKMKHPSPVGQFEPRFVLVDSSPVSMARLDYFILSYKHENVLRADCDNQLFMGYGRTRGNERFILPDASSSTVVWYINDTNNPLEVTTVNYEDSTGSGKAFFSLATNYSTYVAFDPAKPLKRIVSYESVENQNLHGLAVPDMLIITTESFKEEAQRLADMHAAVDGQDVTVVTQDQVFNEFSSGVREGMAYRLICKMFYDRDPVKFKNLLLFGTGSYDNREIMGKHPNNLLTYQSDNSNNSNYSFTTDDFFGFLNDNSGTNIGNERMSIGVGRITCNDVAEAKNDVDKIIEYYANPDYGVWRNNNIVISDSPDNGIYMFQAQGYQNQIDNALNTGMNVSSVHNSQYPRSTIEPTTDVPRKTATEGKKQLTYLLKDGAYFANYVGHAGPISLTKYNKMWTTGDVARVNYPHLPIMMTSCCNVAHYDNDSRGIAELMFHKRDGGAIALFTASRMVIASDNDQLNRYFLNAMFSYDANGVMPTLGQACKEAKLGFTTTNVNKLSFFLLGDPAMKVNYPISRFNIISVNGTNVNNSSTCARISPLGRFDVKAHVMDDNGNIDTSFNGDATVSLYDRDYIFTTLTFPVDGTNTERDIYHHRPKIAEISGRVTAGVFTGTMIAPKSPLAKNDTVLLRVYAHKDGTDYMVNGFTKQVIMRKYDEAQAIQDAEAPVIDMMCLNDETTFADGATVGPDAVLYITAHDNEGIDVQSNSIDNSMKLTLDGGKQSYGEITSYATVHDGSKQVDIEFPLSNLAEGLHTLTYTVFDMLGNSATRTITFMVGQNNDVNLVADKLPAFVNGDVNFDLESSISRMPEVTIRVTDAIGRLVWMTKTDHFPVNWDMKDLEGNKVAPGLYRYFGTYSDGVNYGGTPINKLIVLDALK